MSVVSRQGQWRHFALSLVAAAALIVVTALGVAYVLDPYDTGRSPLVQKPGVRPQGARTAGASRARDRAFNAAIFGNSQIQLLSPERLNALTGLSFVQLSIPGSGPEEQLTLIRWFMRHHPDARALVIGVGKNWCTAQPAMPSEHPFPYWLYSLDPLEYARGLLRLDVLQEIPRRLGYLFAKRPARASPDGYWDYELNYAALGLDHGSPGKLASTSRSQQVWGTMPLDASPLLSGCASWPPPSLRQSRSQSCSRRFTHGFSRSPARWPKPRRQRVRALSLGQSLGSQTRS